MSSVTNVLTPIHLLTGDKQEILQWLKTMPLLSPTEQKTAKKEWRHLYKEYDMLKKMNFSFFAHCMNNKKAISVVDYLMWAEEKEYPWYLIQGWDVELKERSAMMQALVDCFKTHDIERWMNHPQNAIASVLAKDYWYLICAMLEHHNAFNTYQEMIMRYYSKISWEVGRHFIEDMPVQWLANLKEIPEAWIEKGLQCVDLLTIIDTDQYISIKTMGESIQQEGVLFL